MRYYWQFKNGSIVKINPKDWVGILLGDINPFHCWDRSLGAWICYER